MRSVGSVVAVAVKGHRTHDAERKKERERGKEGRRIPVGRSVGRTDGNFGPILLIKGTIHGASERASFLQLELENKELAGSYS